MSRKRIEVNMLPELNDILAYKNADILARFEIDYPQAKLSAQDAFEELKKYIWLCLKHRADKLNEPENALLNFSCVMHHEMVEIDYMWHTFILFTQEYHDFCNNILKSGYFHHQPNVNMQAPAPSEDYAEELERYLSYIYDNLGEETLTKWFPETN